MSRRLAALQGAALETDVHGDGFLVRFTLPTVETPVALVVDDNADVVLLFQRYLGGLFDVHEATSGEQALQLARRLRPNVITLDVMMPSQDGWEVLQILKHDPATAAIPVIVCSVIRERELALSLGAAEFLAKPISAPELLAALQRCCFPP
ncbi:MAG: response regulator [Chloroflexi bacterium]|nr:response regulator [Chloroflexota bacterium]